MKTLTGAQTLPSSMPAEDRPDDIGVRRWPLPLSEPAYHGLAGSIVRTIEPHTEADPAALLFQFLAAFGNVIGRKAFFKVGSTVHALILFVLLVGATAKGRKGTALDEVMGLFRAIDETWVVERRQSGLSSGEGVIWAVRDAALNPTDGSRIDIGVADKRLLVVEPEFGGPLRVLKREGNTLSPVLRQAWDGGNLRILNKNSAAAATDGHIAVIGHLSAEELKREMDFSSASNGFGNRFLWACVRRSKLLPDGGRVDEAALTPLIDALKRVVETARAGGELRRDSGATALWHEVYPTLSEPRPGGHGSLTARAEAQTMRLACLYALLDGTLVIGESHLRVALEVWRYVDDSVRFLFGDGLGDRVADRLLRGLRSRLADGLTRTDIRDLLHRHGTSAQIDDALELLAECGLARVVRTDTAGRPEERWFAVL